MNIPKTLFGSAGLVAGFYTSLFVVWAATYDDLIYSLLRGTYLYAIGFVAGSTIIAALLRLFAPRPEDFSRDQ